MSVADLDSDPSHASAGESDADDTEKLLLQSMLNQEQIYSKKDLFDTKSMHSAVSKMPSVMSAEHSSSQSTGYQTPDRTYALKALRSSAGLLVEPSTESTRKIKEDLSEKYLKELLDSLLVMTDNATPEAESGKFFIQTLVDYMKTNWESLSVFTRIHNLFDGNNQGFKVDGSGANRLVQMLVDPGYPIGRVDVGKDGQCAWRSTSVRLVGNEKMWRPIRLCLLHFGYTQRPQFFLSEDMKPNYIEIVEEESRGRPDYYLQQMYGGKVASYQAGTFELGLASKFFGFDVVIFYLLDRKAVLRAVHKRDGPAVDGEIPSVHDSFWVLHCGVAHDHWEPLMPATVYPKAPRGLSLKQTLAVMKSPATAPHGRHFDVEYATRERPTPPTEPMLPMKVTPVEVKDGVPPPGESTGAEMFHMADDSDADLQDCTSCSSEETTAYILKVQRQVEQYKARQREKRQRRKLERMSQRKTVVPTAPKLAKHRMHAEQTPASSPAQSSPTQSSPDDQHLSPPVAQDPPAQAGAPGAAPAAAPGPAPGLAPPAAPSPPPGLAPGVAPVAVAAVFPHPGLPKCRH